jgi:CRP/FNR family transcriptional regulator, anaerobic regulatory protein
VNHSVLAERLGRYLKLSETEQSTLAELEETERSVPRGTVLRAEQSPARELFVVKRGWLFSSMLLSDGNRQILTLHLPGDLAGDVSLSWDKAPFTLTAATDAVVRVIEKTALRRLFDRQPRLALLMYASAQAERVALADRLASVGRTPARARIAALICDIQRRLRASGGTVDAGVPLPLTQEEIGDATGLTAVHVNRMMRQLAEEGLIARTNGRVRVLDEDRLAGIANHTDRHAAIDMGWLKS